MPSSMKTRQNLGIMVAVFSSILAVVSMLGVVPRIRLVEAVGLFATAFGAGAGVADALATRRLLR